MATGPELPIFPTPEQLMDVIPTLRDFQFLSNQGVHSILPEGHSYLAQDPHNERNLAEFQIITNIGKPYTWMEPSIRRHITEEKVDLGRFNGQAHFLGEYASVNDRVKATEVSILAEMLTHQNSFGDPKSNESRRIYQQAERRLMEENLKYATEKGLVNSNSIYMIPYDGGRVFGDLIDPEAPLLTANFKRIQVDADSGKIADQDLYVAIDGIEITNEDKLNFEEDVTAVWVDDCFATGGSALGGLEMLQGKIKKFVVMVTYANVDAVDEIIRRGKDLGIEVQVVASKPNDRVNDKYYLERNVSRLHIGQETSGRLIMPQAVGDMGTWGQPIDGQAMWGENKKAANVKRLAEYWDEQAAA